MRIGDIAPYVGSELKQQLESLAMSFKGFPYHVHLKGHGGSHDAHRDKFTLYWTTKKEHFGTPDRSDVVSELYCQVVGLHDGRVLLNAKAMRRKRYLGQEYSGRYDERDWYKQDWREDYFLVEASASAVWTVMEAHANFEGAVEQVMSA